VAYHGFVKVMSEPSYDSQDEEEVTRHREPKRSRKGGERLSWLSKDEGAQRPVR